MTVRPLTMPDLDSASGHTCAHCGGEILWKHLSFRMDGRVYHDACPPSAPVAKAMPPEPARPRKPQPWEWRQGRLV